MLKEQKTELNLLLGGQHGFALLQLAWHEFNTKALGASPWLCEANDSP